MSVPLDSVQTINVSFIWSISIAIYCCETYLVAFGIRRLWLSLSPKASVQADPPTPHRFLIHPAQGALAFR